MSVLVMEPLVIQGRRRAAVDADAVTMALSVTARAPVSGVALTNRAAGRLRDDAAFGGFRYDPTAQDAAEVARAAARATARATAPPAVPVTQPDRTSGTGSSLTDQTADAAPTAAGQGRQAAGPRRIAFGGFAYEATAQDAAEVAAAATGAAAAAGTAAGAVGTGVPSAAEAGVAAALGASVSAAVEPGAPGAVSATTATAAVSAAGQPASGIETPAGLVSAVTAAANAIPHPIVPGSAVDAAVSPTTSEAIRRASGRPAGGGGPVRPPRPVDPIEIDPVPSATAAIQLALNARLPELAMPALEAMPDGTMPRLGQVGDIEPEELAVRVDVDSPASDAATLNQTEAARRSTVAATPVPDPTAPAEIPVEPPTLVDFRRDPPPPVPAAQASVDQAQIVRTLAIIAAEVPRNAQAVVNAAREQAFPEGRLATSFPEVSAPLEPGVESALNAKLAELQAAAHIAADTLATAVEARRAELAAGVQHVVTDSELQATQAADTITTAAARENARVEAQRRRDEARRVANLRAALHSHDPTLVEGLVTARLGYIDADIGRGTVAIETAKARRLALIGAYETAYREAYRTTDDAWQHPAGRDTRAPPNLGDRLWFDVVSDHLTAAMNGLRAQTETDATTLTTNLQTAGRDAKAAVRTWSDERLHRTQTADEAAARTAVDNDATAAAITQARSDAQQAGVRQQMVAELRLVSAAYLQARADAQGQATSGAQRLDEATMAMANRYLAAGSPTDPMSGVAAVMMARFTHESAPDLARQIHTTLTALIPVASDVQAHDLGDVMFPGGSGGLDARVSRLWRAFEGIGTDEDEVYAALGGLDDDATKLINRAYFLRHNESLQWRIDDEMSGSDYDQAMGLARGDKAQHARGVIAASDGWFSNHPDQALDAIRALPPGEADAVVNDPATRAHLSTVLGGTRWVDSRGYVTDDRGERELQILLDINRQAANPGQPLTGHERDLQARADAIDFDRAVRQGTEGAPPLDAVFNRIRASIVADPRTASWSADEIDNEVRRRARAMENAYEREFGGELPGGGESALRTAIARSTWGTNHQLALDLLNVNRAGERATRIQATTNGLYTSDSELNTELDRTYRDALAEVNRAAVYRRTIEDRARQLMDTDGITAGGRRPSPREVETYRQEATEELAHQLARTWFADMRRTFGERYADRWGGQGDEVLQNMVVSETQFGGEREALDRLGPARPGTDLRTGGSGGLSAAQLVGHGVAGWGMDREQVLGALGGRTTQQLARIGAAYQQEFHEDMTARLQSETGGWTAATPDSRLERDAFDVREALRGVPLTPQDEVNAARRRYEYERDVYFRNNPYERDLAVGDELADMRRQFERVQARMTEYNDAASHGDTERMRILEAAVRRSHDSLDVSADRYRGAVDAYVNRSAQIAAIVAAVVVAVVITVVTAGAAGPVVLALAASLAGTAASMATKADILGAAYSRTDIETDLIVGVVDAVVSVLTARLGNILLGLPKPQGATQAALRASMRSIERQALARPVLARAAAFAAEQMAQSVPSAVTGALLSRDTWRGDPLRNVASAAGMAALVGVGVGSAVHGVSHFGPKMLGAAADLLRPARASAADPAARAAQAALHNEMMAHLLAGVSGPERDLVRETRIVVLSDAEFAARTGSESNGHAATLAIKGEPVVVVREGADLARLREEGLHVLQFFDPAQAERLRLVDETRLADWSQVSLPERIAAWHAKLDLELDVQSRLIGQLEHELANPGLSPGEAASRLTMLEDARAAASVLGERRLRLNGLEPGELAAMRRGDLAPPAFLDDEPRLFNKSRSARSSLTAADRAEIDAAVREMETAGEVGPRLLGEQREFPQPAFREGGRRSRWVRVFNDFGQEVTRYLERWRSGGFWGKSGQVGRWQGGVAEIAGRLENRRLTGGTGPVRHVQFDAQTGRGTGFDDLLFRFTHAADGSVRAEARVFEFKHYGDTLVSDFSAIDENFGQNLARVRERLVELRNRGGSALAEAGMSAAEVDAAIAAVDGRRVEVTVRTAGETRVQPADLVDIQRRLNRGVPGRPVRVNLDPVRIAPEALAEGAFWWDVAEHYRTMPANSPDRDLFRSLATRPNGMSPDSIRVADAVVSARRSGQVSGSIRWAADGRYLISGDGPFVVHSPARPASGAFDPTAEARLILAQADRSVPVPGAAGRQPLRVVVDYSALNGGESRALLDALARLSPPASGTPVARRIRAVGLPPGIAMP